MHISGGLKTYIAGAGIAVTAYFSAVEASALVIMPGESAMLPAVTGATNPELVGTLLNDTSQTADFEPLDIFFAMYTYRDRVVRSDVGGATIIAPQLDTIGNNTGTVYFVDELMLSGYAGFQTDVSYRTDASGDRGPTRVERSIDGNDLHFIFEFPLILGTLTSQPQQSSFPINILTDANSFEATGTASIFARNDTDVSDTFSFALTNVSAPARVDFPIGPNPPTGVPTPPAFVLWLSGLTYLGFALKRRT